jgi:hypothetical protein
MDRNSIKAIALENTKAYVETRISALGQMRNILSSVNGDTRPYECAMDELQNVLNLIKKLERL